MELLHSKDLTVTRRAALGQDVSAASGSAFKSTEATLMSGHHDIRLRHCPQTSDTS